MDSKDKIDIIYCDFDGTITKKDAVNSFFELYADKKWVEYEQLWIDGKISSKENAIKQVALVKEMNQETLDNFIDSIEIDEYFLDFYKFLKLQKIKLVIVSDGFDLFIEKILKRLNIDDVEFYANHLIYKNNKFKIEFPHHKTSCGIKAGLCKCSIINTTDFCYIGDGTSDKCPAQKASTLFAKKTLKNFCDKIRKKYISFDTFEDIINVLKTKGVNI